jgi:glucosamine--fructose-6-phosphate aminotransferase (isomerizing)
MEKELYDIPVQAKLCYEKNKGLILPEKVPYIGMGSSYFAAIVLRYLGVRIIPELAAEYFYYIQKIRQFENAVLISQSGQTTDVINCSRCFREFVAIVNQFDSSLVSQPNLKSVVRIYAGDERYSSTKTFVNTLIVLYLGHGFDVKPALDLMERKYSELVYAGESIGVQIESSIKKKRLKCINIIGNGPNVGTACQAALTLSESTKLPFVGMSATQYEHGYKETAENALVIVINPSKSYLFARTRKLIKILSNAGTQVFEISETELDEMYSPFTSIILFYFMARYLASKFGISLPFTVGNKITERNSD